MLNAIDLSKTYNAFRLSGINLNLPDGYIMGLIGVNGAGKTTLLKLLVGMERADGGIISIDDILLSENQKAYKDDIGFVLLEDLFLNHSSLIKNACTYGKYYSRYSKEQFIDYCRRFNLDINKKYGHLSRGEKLKFQFAFALSHSPKVLLLDEPTANFDKEFRKEFLKIITEFVSDGKRNVIIATHLTEDLDRVADYVTLMHNGKIEFSMNRSELEEAYRLVSGREEDFRFIDKKYIIYKEMGKFGSKALVDYRNVTGKYLGNALTIEIPSIEDIMYYLIKGKESEVR